jgi:hypothetical protein
MWKEAVVAYFNILSRHFPGETEKTHENPPSGYPVSGPKTKQECLPLDHDVRSFTFLYKMSSSSSSLYSITNLGQGGLFRSQLSYRLVVSKVVVQVGRLPFG